MAKITIKELEPLRPPTMPAESSERMPIWPVESQWSMKLGSAHTGSANSPDRPPEKTITPGKCLAL